MDFIGNVAKAVSEGVSKVGKSAGREVTRALEEHVTHIEEDFDSISKAIDQGGLLGGLVQAADVFSPGHMVANGLDAWNVIPEDPALKELISGGVNFLIPTVPTKLLALKDLADSIGAIKADQGARGSAELPPAHSAEPPHHAPTCERGWSPAPAFGHTGSVIMIGSSSYAGCGRLEDALAKFRDSLTGVCGKGGSNGDELDREIRKILANPNLMFEDMVFLLMRAFIKDTRRQVTGMTEDLRGTRELDQAERERLQGDLNAAREKLATAQGAGDPGAIARASNRVEELRAKLDATTSDRTESRADKFEELKQVMQRLSEMEQALSNVLNTMHESSMAAIRNIR